jgi:hypothetical protein
MLSTSKTVYFWLRFEEILLTTEIFAVHYLLEKSLCPPEGSKDTE